MKNVKLLVVIGTTGAGKTKLSIELAKALNGEIINADALQMYKGLDIATAKVTVEEQQGVPHHLLSILSPEEQTSSIVDFRLQALACIADITSRGKLPILVGGTMYYTQSILWGSQTLMDNIPALKLTSNPFQSVQQAFEELERVDPVMANRLHPRDERKILRSLDIYDQTGERHSDWIRKDEQAQASVNSNQTTLQACIFWPRCSERHVLHERLNHRVDEMVKNGLIPEINALYQLYRTTEEPEVEESDYTKGIRQAIGYKEFRPYFNSTDDDELKDEILKQCIERVKVTTRQYARRQLTWIRNRILPRQEFPVYAFDSSDVSTWGEQVRPKALTIAHAFVKNNLDMLNPQEYPVMNNPTTKSSDSIAQWQKFTCDVCHGRILNGQHEWSEHLKSRKHRKLVQRQNRRSVSRREEEEEPEGEESLVQTIIRLVKRMF